MMHFWPKPSKKLRWYQLSVFELILIPILLVLIVYLLLPALGTRGPHGNYIRSMSNMRQALIMMHAYHLDYSAYPVELMDLAEKFNESDVTFLSNPREGFSGYHFRAPDVPLDEIINPTELAVIFEVRDDGTVAYDTGVIGYADGFVEYIPESEE